MQKLNLSEKLALDPEHWSPKVVGQTNDFHVKLVKLQGEFIWHSHHAEDELFLVLTCRLRMRLRDGERTARSARGLKNERGKAPGRPGDQLTP